MENENYLSPNNLYDRSFSNNLINEIRNIFYDCFSFYDSALYSWGSTARREMVNYSDLDLIIVHKGSQFDQKVNKFISTMKFKFPNNKLDLLQKFTISELIRLAKIDGGDRQAITLSRLESDRNAITDEFENCIQEQLFLGYEKTRELLYIMLNLIKVYPYLFLPSDLKFGEYCLRYLNYAYLFCNYFIDKRNSIMDTQTALQKLNFDDVISEKMCKDSIAALNFLILLRNKIQLSTNSENNILDIFENTTNIENSYLGRDITHRMKQHKNTVKELLSVLFVKTMDLIRKELGNRDAEIVDALIYNYSETLGNDLSLLDSEILSIALSYCTTSNETFRLLYDKYSRNWYVLFGIANNRFANSSILNRLVNPIGKAKDILALHQDFAWRNIYLYVARNPTTDLETLKLIINYENAREMDINAGKNNIITKVTK